jgi:hypothetical protein
METKQDKPVKSLKLFTERLIDYAGLFPPANLLLAQAFNNYIVYTQGHYNWMLSKFIITVKKLSELSGLMEEMNIKSKVPLSLISSGGENADKFLKNLKWDIEAIKEFLNKNSNSLSFDVFEIKIPQGLDLANKKDNLKVLINSVNNEIEQNFGKNIQTFYELTVDNNFDYELINTIDTISEFRRSGKNAGFKFRTGGMDPSVFPTSDKITAAMFTCLEFEVPMKFTAGLHHPVRHFNEVQDIEMHGFLNVFGAGILAYCCDLVEEEVVEILESQEAYDFEFDEEGFNWHDFSLSNEKITEARKKFMVSYGSCSFDEPIDDLKMMDLL